MSSGVKAACLACLLLFGAASALAHKGSDAYLDVQEVGPVAGAANAPDVQQIEYRFSLAIAIKDLDLLVPIDANADGKVTWGEVKAAMPLVQALANDAANIEPQPAAAGQASANTCHLNWQGDGVDRRSDGNYIRLAAVSRRRCSSWATPARFW